MNTLGSVTKSRFEHSPEAHKLHIDFEVASGNTVHEADPVLLNNAGQVIPAGAAASAETLIGVCVLKDITGPINRATISMKGYCEVNGEAAAASLNAGPVELGAWNGTTGKREFNVASSVAKTVGHNITQATLDGDPIRVVLLL